MIVQEILKEIFGEEQLYFLEDWLTWQLRYPWDRSYINSVCICGLPGTGKTISIDIIERLMPMSNRVSKLTPIDYSFHPTGLIIKDECTMSDIKKLKYLTTSRKINFESKKYVNRALEVSWHALAATNDEVLHDAKTSLWGNRIIKTLGDVNADLYLEVKNVGDRPFNQYRHYLRGRQFTGKKTLKP